MALSLAISDSAWSKSDVSLGGTTYSITFAFNERDQRWRVSIYKGSTPVILGVKVMETKMLLGPYDLPLFDHGDIGCFRMQSTTEDVGRDNLGIGKEYELIYFSNSEIEEITG
jgi:hypothetical protein